MSSFGSLIFQAETRLYKESWRLSTFAALVVNELVFFIVLYTATSDCTPTMDKSDSITISVADNFCGEPNRFE